ncbi:hypothetical protein F5144DRAFT_503360 [Chaetomium tenue]|uniref:Uncharacterized protein n=1 Tax=Chaetomium tenue TaxID=1854479 RepID=A0ACB7PTN6_9PEZI|nr:hypothetical protein F5144DRAFT_503360 [Chaetomium globosum]
MDAQSPPKRMTRARAAAKTTEPAAKPTRVVTAAAKAKTARSASTITTGTTRTTTLKRKSPSDDDEDNHEMQPARKMTVTDAKPARGRGRPKKVVVEDPAPESAQEPAPATTVRTRGRPKKVTEAPVEEPAKVVKATRTKKATEDTKAAVTEPIKKTTRGRPAGTTMTTTAKAPVKSAMKKTVKFEEPEKENMAPATTATRKASTKASAPAPTTGLRGKPVRRGAAGTTTRAARNTRGTAGSTEPSDKTEKPMPLSPKKVNQLTVNRVESDDELGMDEKIPVRRFKKLPIKLSTGNNKPAKSPALLGENDENAIEINRPETEVNHMLATPAKRMPASPWKGSIQSPAKRVEGLLFPSAVPQVDGKTPQVPTKTGLLQSPAKRQPLNLNPLGSDIACGPSTSPVKLSFLSSPAKRPPVSPIKAMPRFIEEEGRMDQTPAPKPTLLASPLPREALDNSEEAHDAADDVDDDEAMPDSPTRLSFPGRLSAVLPRHADPALTPSVPPTPEVVPQLNVQEPAVEGDVEDAVEDAVEDDVEEENEFEISEEPMVLDDPPVEVLAVESATTTPPASPKVANPMFELREKDLRPYDSDSEEESPMKHGKPTSLFNALPATPCPPSGRQFKSMQSARRSTAKKTQAEDTLGFTPLAQQLSGWAAGPSPLKTGVHTASPIVFAAVDSQRHVGSPARTAGSTPTVLAQNTFFEDEMHIRPEAAEIEEDAATEVGDNDEVMLEDLSFTEEDMELAAEANEMSLLEKEQTSHSIHDQDDSVSEHSQEYGDENAIPMEPAPPVGNSVYAPAIPPVTPQRVICREVHTVAKVPLKPADDSTPRSKPANRRHSGLPPTRRSERITRNSAAFSYSANKGGDIVPFEDETNEQPESAAPVTPQKPDIWSTMGTPARTPRRDLNPGLLRGAVVFVDVHTSEGADASSVFVDLLTQMGARCVKTWSWNPNSSSDAGADSRVGITHVVFKDGGKRTMEKVRESRGLVQCVGVTWVLDCERDNQWLEEAPYYIDTSFVPRGGARRRKSMEPRAISNLNSKPRNSRGSQTTHRTPDNNRRASALWVRSPEKSLSNDGEDNGNADDEDEDTEWGSLTPVPKTPAPEAIARFAANVSPGPATPSSVGSVDSDDDTIGLDDDAHGSQEMLMRTCPPKRTTFVEPGHGILGRPKDESVHLRLMAARRKSLQFAPKVGSPLSKTWKAWN